MDIPVGLPDRTDAEIKYRDDPYVLWLIDQVYADIHMPSNLKEDEDELGID